MLTGLQGLFEIALNFYSLKSGIHHFLRSKLIRKMYVKYNNNNNNNNNTLFKFSNLIA